MTGPITSLKILGYDFINLNQNISQKRLNLQKTAENVKILVKSKENTIILIERRTVC